MSVVDKIQHYQRSLERCTDNGSRTLHCIEKLYRLPVTVQHLQETGVGRTVNALRKYDGSIGDAAKALVAKWKTMVVDEDTSDGEDDDEACVPDAPEGYSDNSNSPKPDKQNRYDSSKNSSKHSSNESNDRRHYTEKHESRHGTKNASCENSKSRENELKTSRESNEDTQKYTKNGMSKKSSKSEENETRGEKKSKSTRESKSESSKRESSREEASSRNGMITSDKTSVTKSEDGRKSSGRVSSSSGSGNHSGTTKNRSTSHDSGRKRKLEDSSSDREIGKRRRSMEDDDENENKIKEHGDDDDEDREEEEEDDDDDDDDRPTQILSRDSDNEMGKILPYTSFDTESDDNTPKIKIKREAPDSPTCSDRGSAESRRSHKMDKSSKSKNRETLEKSTSSTSTKSKRDSEKRERSKNEKDAAEHRKSEKRKDATTRSPSGESSSKSKSESKSSSSSKDRRRSKEKQEVRESSKSKKDNVSENDNKHSKEKFKEPKDKKVKKRKIEGDGGIDCNSGASFAEALGMCTDRPSSRKKNPVSPSSPLIKTIKTEPGTSSSTLPSSSKNSVKIKTEESSSDTQALSLLAPNVKLEPLNVDLASTLPEISPNYKPLPAHYGNAILRKQDEDKALSDVIYAKGQRTKVYSGNKCGYTTVPSLSEVCIRVLIHHMDALGFTGGIPYYILKPVLERAMPDQLFTLENYNPYLIDDTDSLWQFHCNREFREKRREEMESWRDMYMRCRDEREVKLKALTANIKESIDKSVPVRSTKLAYVDNVVKPPRNVLRNQAKYGTAHSSTPASDLKKKLILGGGSNSATNISLPPPPMARMKSSASNNGKKNKAPLMAKALQLIKARYKR